MREMVLGITQQGWLGGGGQKVQGGGHQGRIHWEEESQHSLMELESPACRNLGREEQQGQKSGGQSPPGRLEDWPEPGVARAG